ncbi:MAG: endonuclease/exonuclease/phosphatase family protein [Myxococcota bacterium]
MRSSLAVLLVFVACGPPPVEPRDAGSEGEVDAGTSLRVRLGTFNTHLFFDTVCQSGSCAPADFEAQPTQAEFDARAAQLAQAVTSLQTDVLALQEVENQVCLDALLSRLGDVMPHGALGELGFAASVDVAVLSKRPIDKVVKRRATEPLTRPDGSSTTFSRELLEVHTTAADGTRLIVVAAHFRSKVNDDPGRRLAEAQASRRVLEAIALAEPDALVVLGGDLNDTPGSPPLEALTADGGLIRAAGDRPVADQATYIYFGQGQAIDHLLQAPTAGGTLVPYSATTWKDGRGWGGSDHLALTADWNLRAR